MPAAGERMAAHDLLDYFWSWKSFSRAVLRRIHDQEGFQLGGSKFASGTQFPAAGFFFFDEAGFPYYRETSAAQNITFNDTDGTLALWVVPTTQEAPLSRLITSDWSEVEFYAQDATLSDPPGKAGFKLGQGTAGGSSFSSFTYDSGRWYPGYYDLAGLNLEYDSNMRLQVNAGDLAGTGLEEHADGTLRIAAAAAGLGLGGGSGSALAFDGSEVVGDGLEVASSQLQVKLNGSNLSRSASGLKIADGGVYYTRINDTLQDFLPTSPAWTIGSEVGDTIRVSCQFRDTAGNNLSQYCTAFFNISTGSGGMAQGTALTDVTVVTGTAYWYIAKFTAHIVTNSTGLFEINLKYTGGALTRYCNVNILGRRYASPAINWT